MQSCKNASAEEKIFPFHQRPFLRLFAHSVRASPSHFLATRSRAVWISLDLDRISAAVGVWISLTASTTPRAILVLFQFLLNLFSMSAQLAVASISVGRVIHADVADDLRSAPA